MNNVPFIKKIILVVFALQISLDSFAFDQGNFELMGITVNPDYLTKLIETSSVSNTPEEMTERAAKAFPWIDFIVKKPFDPKIQGHASPSSNNFVDSKIPKLKRDIVSHYSGSRGSAIPGDNRVLKIKGIGQWENKRPTVAIAVNATKSTLAHEILHILILDAYKTLKTKYASDQLIKNNSLNSFHFIKTHLNGKNVDLDLLSRTYLMIGGQLEHIDLVYFLLKYQKEMKFTKEDHEKNIYFMRKNYLISSNRTFVVSSRDEIRFNTEDLKLVKAFSKKICDKLIKIFEIAPGAMPKKQIFQTDFNNNCL